MKKIAILTAAVLLLTGCAAVKTQMDSLTPGGDLGGLPDDAKSKSIVAGAATAPNSVFEEAEFFDADGVAADYADIEQESVQARIEKSAGTAYNEIEENPVISTAEQDTVTFSLKIDTASYTNVKYYIENGIIPPRNATRIEELLNYFDYKRPTPDAGSPFGISAEVAPSPFAGDDDSLVAMVNVSTPDVDVSALRPANLTFLIDTSGSMADSDKLPLLTRGFELLTENLRESDTVSIVTYAGSSEIVLDSVNGTSRDKIFAALNSLTAGGGTDGSGGIETAYRLAKKNYKEGANNRVILATDGDFNVGLTENTDLADYIASKKSDGIYLSIIGFGTGGVDDGIMETLSKNGGGNYSFVHTLEDAKKVLVDNMGASFTVADDVKAQIKFSPALVKSYKLIGYENRLLANEDFADDTKDAGEIGRGNNVIALFDLRMTDNYHVQSGNLFEVDIRYKSPIGSADNKDGLGESKLITKYVTPPSIADKGSNDFNFANAVAAFGYLCRGTDFYTSDADEISQVAAAAAGTNAEKREFAALVKKLGALVEQDKSLETSDIPKPNLDVPEN